MGREKEMMIEAMSRQWWPTEKYICSECLTAPSLQKTIRSNLVTDHCCDYCGRKKAASLDFLLEHQIMPAIWSEYSEAVNELGWNDGEWVGSVTETYDLIEELFSPFDGTDSGDLIKDLQNSILETEWCRSNYYSVQPEEKRLFRWRGFAQIVKHSSRYFFGSMVIEKEPSEHDETDIKGFLGDIKRVVKKDLVRSISGGALAYRARIDKQKHTVLCELAAPPTQYARFSNRMTPSGISMFYGSFDGETAMAEVGAIEEGKILSLAKIRMNREIKVVDFTHLPAHPDFFDLKQRNRFYLCEFLQRFVSELSAPVVKDGREHIDYVPTQVLTEYLKISLPIDGMIFSSSKHSDGKCIVLWGSDFVPDWQGVSPGFELVDVSCFKEGYSPIEEESD